MTNYIDPLPMTRESRLNPLISFPVFEHGTTTCSAHQPSIAGSARASPLQLFASNDIPPSARPLCHCCRKTNLILWLSGQLQPPFELNNSTPPCAPAPVNHTTFRYGLLTMDAQDSHMAPFTAINHALLSPWRWRGKTVGVHVLE
jgi:hypothetical protein